MCRVLANEALEWDSYQVFHWPHGPIQEAKVLMPTSKSELNHFSEFENLNAHLLNGKARIDSAA